MDIESDVVRIDLRGDITGSDLLEAIINARDLSMKGKLQLWDARDVVNVKVEPDVLDALHDLMKLRVEHGVEIGGKRAVITPSEDVASVAEIIAGEFEGLGVDIRVFADEPSAMDWLSA